ncbi:MAG: GWxTD domain-containing protein [Flavobacteriales bacterium]
MNRIKFNIGITLLLVLLFANASAGVQAIFSYKQFQVPNKGIYIETYLSFVSASLKYKNAESDKLQANLLVTQILKKEGEVVDFKKYKVLGPVLVDSIAVDFKDQKRFFLEPGEYEMEVTIKDLKNPDPGHSVTRNKISIKPYSKQINLSDIELVDYLEKTKEKNQFSKSGYDIYPKVSNYLPTDVSKLVYYLELYNKSIPQKVLVKQYIETYYGNKLLPSFLKRSVKNMGEVTPILNLFDITKLPSGNYNLVVEIRDSLNQLIVSDKVFLQRVNAEMEEKQIVSLEKNEQQLTYDLQKDSINYFLECLVPIASSREYKLLAGKKTKLTYEQKERYFVNFWQNRHGKNAIPEWNKYRELIAEVDKLFGTRVKRGYETDMGRVYLKYGKPSDVIDKRNEQGTYPYAIWHYYKTNMRSNVIFVFYQSTAAAEDFELIHSDMQGELNNSNWKLLINNRVGGGDNRLDEDERRMR